jgi:hypothetical protein
MTVSPAFSSALPHRVSLFDRSTFFEKALAYGVRHNLLSQEKLDAIETDAPKGMVQIARYFGSEFLRPELEKAKDRIVNLVSLNLELGLQVLYMRRLTFINSKSYHHLNQSLLPLHIHHRFHRLPVLLEPSSRNPVQLQDFVKLHCSHP